MKRVLITGANSYVGTNVEKWLMKEPEKYDVATLDMRNPDWTNYDFSKFDVVFHVAGIAHLKETKKTKLTYYSVNRDLAIQTANISKISGVKHFIFVSTMSVFGVSSGKIDNKTKPNPKSHYGKSKYMAENSIKVLSDECFITSIVRPPMIYGPESKGNYTKLSRMVKKISVFPLIDNKRSAIFIDNFSNFIKNVIDYSFTGYLYPQNSEYINTTKLITTIRSVNGLKTKNTRLLNLIFRFFMLLFRPLKKLYGTLIYDFALSPDYNIVNFLDSIIISEQK